MIRRLAVRIVQLALLVAAAGAALVFVLGIVAPPTTSFVLQSRIHETLAGNPGAIAYRWVPHSRISPDLLLAVIAAEDQRFPDHSGFDLDAIEKAVRHNKRGTSVRGASTISQQVAKNLFLWSGRSYLRKGIEAYFTILIELFWSKQRILETYVNVAQFGAMTYGAQAAAQRLFHVDAADLSREQAALMAGALPAPANLRAEAPSAYLRKRQRWILSQMSALGGRAYLKRIAPQLGAR